MEGSLENIKKPKKLKLDFRGSKYATGRRKKSVAKVWVKKGSGQIHINGLKMNTLQAERALDIVFKNLKELN